MNKLVIDKKAVKENLAVIKSKAAKASIYAELNGGVWGTELADAVLMLREEGVSRFAVYEPGEAAAIREAGLVEEEILIKRTVTDREELERLLDLNAVFTIGSYDTGMALNGIAESRSTVAVAHIRVDSGTGCRGFSTSEVDKIISIFNYTPNIAIAGVYTQLIDGEKAEPGAAAQLGRFSEVVEKIREAGFETGTTHAAGDIALLNSEISGLDAVHAGGAVLGLVPNANRYGLSKAAFIESRIEETRWLAQGLTAGEGATYKVKKPIRVALVPVGYSHGFCVEKARDSFKLSDWWRGGWRLLADWAKRKKITVTINERKARVLGRVGMYSMVVDVTKCDCEAGAPVRIEAGPIFTGRLPVEFR